VVGDPPQGVLHGREVGVVQVGPPPRQPLPLGTHDEADPVGEVVVPASAIDRHTHTLILPAVVVIAPKGRSRAARRAHGRIEDGAV
jgi:hypothetical protein